MFELDDEATLFLYCWTFNEMQIPATRDRSKCRRPANLRRKRPPLRMIAFVQPGSQEPFMRRSAINFSSADCYGPEQTCEAP